MSKKIVEDILYILCRPLLPILTIYLLLILPGLMDYSLVANSKTIDGIIRLGLAIGLSLTYWQFPVLFEPNSGKWLWITRSTLENPVSLKIYYLWFSFVNCIAMGGFIYYAFSTFLPELRGFRFLAPVVNAIIMAGLYHWRYSYFLELVKKQKV